MELQRVGMGGRAGEGYKKWMVMVEREPAEEPHTLEVPPRLGGPHELKPVEEVRRAGSRRE